MIRPFGFQLRASAEIASKFASYWAVSPVSGPAKKPIRVPFFQTLTSLTGSGKTVMMAQAVSEMAALLPVQPIVIWLAKGTVVVAQSYANLQGGGRYNHLLDGFEVRTLGDFDKKDLDDPNQALVYFATVGTFNRQGGADSGLHVFRTDIDEAAQSTWQALAARSSGEEERPLLIVYDEAQNLSDGQTRLLMELEPAAFLVASATPKLPSEVVRSTEMLKTAMGWTDDDLVTKVDPGEVVEEGLVKQDVLMGGYEETMERTIDQLMDDFSAAEAAVEQLGVTLKPKAIYVCKTNIVEGNANERDNPKRPFSQREAPPILIWRYLVEQKGIDPASIAVYCRLDFDKSYKPPEEFIHFKGANSDYELFTAGDFRHVIFNLTLQEGWDDPFCYFAYIDKSMGSRMQVQQVIGRVLRQPQAQHYGIDALNTANIYVRVDERGVFKQVVEDVSRELGQENPEVRLTTYDSKTKKRPVTCPAKQRVEVPRIYRSPDQAQAAIDRLIDGILDFRSLDATNVTGIGGRAQVRHHVGKAGSPDLEWTELSNNNAVSARWIFQTAVQRQFPDALEVTRSDDPKFDGKVQLRSPAEATIVKTANEVVAKYLELTRLKQQGPNPYVPLEVTNDPSKVEKFKNALHSEYSGLNKAELACARELDDTELLWCRNPSKTGYGIPLLTLGASKKFYPDFIVWKGDDIFLIDPSGEHIVQDKLVRKLLAVEPHPRDKRRVHVRLYSAGEWTENGQHLGKDGFTVFGLGNAHALRTVTCNSVAEAVVACLDADLV